VEGACHIGLIFTVTRAFLAVEYAILTHCALCRRRDRLLTAGNAPDKKLALETARRLGE
jgi:hypothetical protein